MARPESIAVGGYFQTPLRLVPHFARLVSVPPQRKRSYDRNADNTDTGPVTFLDPCIGEGQAVLDLVRALVGAEPPPEPPVKPELYPDPAPLRSDADGWAVKRHEKDMLYAKRRRETDAHGYKVAVERHAKDLAEYEARKAAGTLPIHEDDADLFGCELEQGRYEECKQKLPHQWTQNLLHGDAFHARWADSSDGVSVLFLNPPYDTDREYGRFEQRFLARFTLTLAPGGTVFYLVPHYSLSASADWLATHFDRVECRRFPTPEYKVFRQVVLVARRAETALRAPQPKIAAKIQKWADDPTSIPVLTAHEEPLWPVPRADSTSDALHDWRMMALDLGALLDKTAPWHQTVRGGGPQEIPGILPEPGGDLLRRVYPVAVPPRASHIAAGIASGVFNGSTLHPDDKASPLPPILVKGVFDREYRTVEEKANKDGEVTGLVQVQQPRLSVTALDLRSYQFSTLTPTVQPAGATEVPGMSTGDLLKVYGRGLLAALYEHCPVLHDPARPGDAFPVPFATKGTVPETAGGPRTLYPAQTQAVLAIVKLLGGPKAKLRERHGKAAVLAGEIGVGKSCTALAVARTLGAGRTLVLCPPHLLDSWQDQVRAATPWAHVAVLDSVTDVDDFAASPVRPAVAILSREMAKLGHALRAVSGSCPKCGGPLPEGDLAKRRAVCGHRRLLPQDQDAQRAVMLARTLAVAAPDDARVAPLIHERPFLRLMERALAATPDDRAKAARAARSRPRLAALTREVAAEVAVGKGSPDVLLRLCAGIGDDALTADVALGLYERSRRDPDRHGDGHGLRGTAYRLLLVLSPKARKAAVAKIDANPVPEEKRGYSYGEKLRTAWEEWKQEAASIMKGEKVVWGEYSKFSVTGGVPIYDGHSVGATEHLLVALASLAAAGKWRESKPCGERLYGAVPRPRRYPLADYICKRHPHLFDFLVLDEAHEAANSESAQSLAALRLVALGQPTVAMTGSLMNGYAESLFALLWALSPAFREEFERDQKSAFVDRYGYKKRLVEHRDGKGQAVPLYGSVTDRVESTREIGPAPGVLPLLLLRHLLPIAVTLQKADLALDLPRCREIPSVVAPLPEQGRRHEKMLRTLLQQIKRDRFVPEKAGRLLGALADAPSQLDRATKDTGNVEDGGYEIRYPASAGGDLVHRVEPLPEDTVLPKEQWALDLVEKELAAGRNCILLAWHRNVLPRLTRLCKARGLPVAMLDRQKVPTHKREAWINQTIAAGCRVLVTNPVAIATGLNPLVHFATEVFLESPACNPIVYRQVIGRVDRIGQKKETRIHYPVYEMASQKTLHKLLMSKVAVSVAVDGLDATEALAAAGAETAPEHSGLAVGQALYDLLAGEGRRRTA